MNTDRVALSGNELGALCLKAARGAGFHWGMAEESAHAARWLHAHGLPGCDALLAHLLHIANCALIPELHEGCFTSRDNRPLCPVHLGVSVTDDVGVRPIHFSIKRVHQPLLLLPFVQAASFKDRAMYGLRWTQQSVSLTPDGLVAGDVNALTELRDSDMLIQPIDAALEPWQIRPDTSVSHSTLEKLEQLAMNTTVPPSRTSRQDAGATTDDND